MKVSSSCQWSHSSSWVRMLRMVRMVRMVDQSLLLLSLPLLSSAGPFHPFLHGLFGFRDSDAGSTSTFTSMPITAPPPNEASGLCPRKSIDYRVGKVTAYTGSSGGHCGFTQLPQGVGDKYVAISHLGWMEGHSVAPVFASSILMGRWDNFQKRQEITFHLCAVSLVFSSYISSYLSYLYQ